MIYKKFVVIFVVLLSGCAKNWHIPLLPGVKNNIREAEVHISLMQKEMHVSFKHEYSEVTSEGGVLGSVIYGVYDLFNNFSREIELDEMIQPVNKVLVSYDVNEKLLLHYKNMLGPIRWINSNNIFIHEGIITSRKKKKLAKHSDSDAVLFIEVMYYMPNKLTSIIVLSEVVLYSGRNMSSYLRKDIGSQSSLLFRHSYSYLHPVPVADGISVKDSGAVFEWLTDDGYAIKKAIDLGISLTAKQLSNDLGDAI